MIINFNNKLFTTKYKQYILDTFNHAIDIIDPACRDLEVNIAFVSQSDIRKINKEFRGVDKVTDVLSFPTLDGGGKIIPNTSILKENFPHDINVESGNIMLGDIYLCLPVCFKQAKEYRTGRKREVSYLALHGLLHLIGYDHIDPSDKAVMRDMEDKILQRKEN